MKKTIRYSILLAAGVLVFAGCKKFLNINHDPNNPLSVPEAALLPAAEINVGTNVSGGFPGVSVNYWTQQISLNQPLPDVENYFIQGVTTNNTWTFTLYPNIMQNMINMIQEAEAAGHTQYAAIGFAINAYTLAVTTDLFGDVAWTQAFQMPKITAPKYDPQQNIYGDIQTLLDSALYYAGQTPSAIAPSGDDFIYGGNMTEWVKFIHFMKARYYLRLSNAPGRTAATQADSALAQLSLAFQSNADNAGVSYPGSQGSAWYENTQPSAGGLVIAQYFNNLLLGNNDPRLPILTSPATAGPDSGAYFGRPSGVDTVYTAPNYFSSVNSFYAGINSPVYLGTYSEQLFIQAEATLLTQGAAAADPIYKTAIGASLNMVGVASADSLAYLATKQSLGTVSNPLQALITEKYVADFLSLETYNDWRRTNYPTLTPVANGVTTYIPRRFPYGSQEILANPQPQDTTQLSTGVWWDPR
jgi:hypothetical protein